MKSTYLRNSPKVKAIAENVHFWYKPKLADVHAICWCDLHQWLSAAAHVTHHPFTASVHWQPDITDLLLSTAAFFPDYIITTFRPELFRWSHILPDEFWCLTQVGSIQVSQGSAETYL